MKSTRKAVIFGFFVWLIPFVVAFAIYPLHESSRPLFESIMPVSIAIAVAVFGVRYLRAVHARFVQEGAILGLLWLAISVIIDAPLMLLGGPMQMTVAQYTADIGVTYLMIPVITIGIAVARATSSGTLSGG
jgi:hypothetical protein